MNSNNIIITTGLFLISFLGYSQDTLSISKNDLLQKLIRLGSEVLLAYQSPPPLYFSLAILYDGWAIALYENKQIAKNIFFISLKINRIKY